MNKLKRFEPFEKDNLYNPNNFDYLYGHDDNGIPKGWISVMNKDAMCVIQTSKRDDQTDIKIYDRFPITEMMTNGEEMKVCIGSDWNNEGIYADIPFEPTMDKVHYLGNYLFIVRMV